MHAYKVILVIKEIVSTKYSLTILLHVAIYLNSCGLKAIQEYCATSELTFKECN